MCLVTSNSAIGCLSCRHRGERCVATVITTLIDGEARYCYACCITAHGGDHRYRVTIHQPGQCYYIDMYMTMVARHSTFRDSARRLPELQSYWYTRSATAMA